MVAISYFTNGDNDTAVENARKIIDDMIKYGYKCKQFGIPGDIVSISFECTDTSKRKELKKYLKTLERKGYSVVNL